MMDNKDGRLDANPSLDIPSGANKFNFWANKPKSKTPMRLAKSSITWVVTLLAVILSMPSRIAARGRQFICMVSNHVIRQQQTYTPQQTRILELLSFIFQDANCKNTNFKYELQRHAITENQPRGIRLSGSLTEMGLRSLEGRPGIPLEGAGNTSGPLCDNSWVVTVARCPACSKPSRSECYSLCPMVILHITKTSLWRPQKGLPLRTAAAVHSQNSFNTIAHSRKAFKLHTFSF